MHRRCKPQFAKQTIKLHLFESPALICLLMYSGSGTIIVRFHTERKQLQPRVNWNGTREENEKVSRSKVLVFPAI